MIHLTYSNQTEALMKALLVRLDDRRRSQINPLAPIVLVVPNRNVEHFVELEVARSLGIAANLRFVRLAQYVADWLGGPLLVGDALLARVADVLTSDAALQKEELAPVRRYLFGSTNESDAVDVRRAQLSLHIARLFEEYGYSRPAMLEAWIRGERRFDDALGPTEAWQAALYEVIADTSARPIAERLAQGTTAPSGTDEVHVFGLSYVARVFSLVYAELSKHVDLYLYTLNPCEEFWEDLETARELRRRRRLSDAEPLWSEEDEDPFRISVDTESPLLRSFGRPGREHIRLLGALTDCDFEPAFVDPLPSNRSAKSEVSEESMPLFARLDRAPLLHRLQHDVLVRAPMRNTAPG